MEKQFRIQRRNGMLIYKDLDDFSYFFAKTELELIRLYTHTCTLSSQREGQKIWLWWSGRANSLFINK